MRKVNPPIPRSYFNSKLINKSPSEDGDDGGGDDDDDEFNCTFPTDLPLARDDHFKTDVNLNFTSVHVPTSIYPCGLFYAGSFSLLRGMRLTIFICQFQIFLCLRLYIGLQT